MTVTTMILHDGTLALVEPKAANPRTDHRVFRANPYGGYEWAHFATWTPIAVARVGTDGGPQNCPRL
jgi:hypothetical protein